MLAGDEHHDIIGRVGELLPIGLGAKRVDVSLHRARMGGEVERALAFVDRAERILIGVERDLGVDHQALPAGNAHDHVGPQPRAFIVGMTDLGREIGMFGEAAAFEDVAQLLLAPAAARLGGVAQRIDQLGGLRRDPLGARLHRLDMPGEQPEVLAPVLLDLGHDLLIALEAVVNRLEHRLERFARGRLALLEALVGALEELLLARSSICPPTSANSRRALPWRLISVRAVALLLRRDQRGWRADRS